MYWAAKPEVITKPIFPQSKKKSGAGKACAVRKNGAIIIINQDERLV